MRKIVVAVTAAALAVSMLASAIPAAAAVSGYDSSYAGESAFVNVAPGQSNEFQVFFANTGTTTWAVGTASQVDLAACLDDKVTCNAQDATEAPWNPGTWLSATRYATSFQTAVAPGSVGTFKYTVTAPAGVAAGNYRFNGALVLHSTGADIHNEGYYQDATVGQAGTPATLTAISPTSGSSNGGTTVTLTGTNFQCTPAFPTVNFGTSAAAVTSCGAGTLLATSPAGAVGAVTVTVTNSGAAPSNGLTYTYMDTTPPAMVSISANGASVTTTWTEPVCRNAGFAPGDYVLTVNGIDQSAFILGDSAPATTCATSYRIALGGFAFTNGDQVILTLTAAGAAKIQDAATPANTAQPQTVGPVTATADTTAPQMSSAVAQADGLTLKITYSEPVTCTTGASTEFGATPTGGALATSTAQSCTAAASGGSTTVNVTFAAGTFTSGVGGTVKYTAGAAPISDLAGNAAVTPQTINYTSFSADVTAPLSQDIRIKTSAGFASLLDTGDVFTVAFNEAMATPTAASKIRVTDADGTIADITCTVNATCALNGTATTIGGVSYPAGQVLTVTLTADPVVLSGFAGTQPGVAIPTTVSDSAGITDTALNPWNIPGSPDKTIN